MNQEKIGSIIKSIRVNNNLTQKEFADTLGVTYQAVSKWENGKNLPDIAILKEISEKFNIDINELLDTKVEKKNNKKVFIIGGVVVLIVAIVLSIILIFNGNDFNFKTIDTTCSEFSISGSAAYNKNKAYIYISNIDYCGEENNTKYKKIVSQLYLSTEKSDEKIYTDSKENITLKDYLNNFSMSVNSNICLNFKGDLMLSISAYDEFDNKTVYDVPLKLSDTCTLN